MDCRNRWLGLEQEGFGIVFSEASACGVAVVAGRSGGSHDAVVDGTTGVILQRSTSIKELQGVIARLHRDPARRLAMGRAGRAHAEAECDWNLLAARLDAGLKAHGA
jgi:phosphatidylinositol alpha-1,6-mannosyltransferase